MSWSAKQMNMRSVEGVRQPHTRSSSEFMCVCVCRCDTSAPLAGCPRTPKLISWAWALPWLSEDFSSTSQEPMKEVRTNERQELHLTKSSMDFLAFLASKYLQNYLHSIVELIRRRYVGQVFYDLCRHPDGDDRPRAGQNSRGDKDVGACHLHPQFPGASSLSGETASTDQ